MEKIKEKAASLLQKCEVVVLSSMNAEGYPRPVPIVRIASEGLSTIWMSTGASSLKQRNSVQTRKQDYVIIPTVTVLS